MPEQLPARRLPAEWEPQDAVQLTFPHAGTDWADMLDEVLPCFVKIAETVSRFEQVLVVCADKEATRPLLRHAVQERLHLVELPSNDTWARDHGGIVVEENGRPVLLDFMFTGWGLKFPANLDNQLTRCLFDQGFFKAEHRYPGLALEGGGIESDGQGTLLTTAECLLSPNRNPHLNKTETENRLRDLFGLDRVLWLHHGYLAGDDTDSHIDTLARFCSPDTISYVRCTDPADEHFTALKAMERELQNFRTAAGEPYRLVPLPWPEACRAADGHRLPATYANFLIVNGAVLAPTYRLPQDAEALEVLAGLFPDREIIGIDCRPLIEQHGSLHCVTMQYPRNSLKFGV
ncbi:MAG: agmatine deiminase family protein [Saprospiraceae bacterium]|nr:agmatine deiminase family protein [Saprospiraceae bacterium]